MVVIKWCGIFVAEDNPAKRKYDCKEFFDRTICMAKKLITEYIEEQSEYGWVLEDQEILSVSGDS